MKVNACMQIAMIHSTFLSNACCRIRCGGMSGALKHPIPPDARLPRDDVLHTMDVFAEPEQGLPAADGPEPLQEPAGSYRVSVESERLSREEHASDAESTASFGRHVLPCSAQRMRP